MSYTFKLTHNNDNSKGHHIASINIQMIFDNDDAECKAVSYLKDSFDNLPEGVVCKYNKFYINNSQHEVYLHLTRTCKFKKDHMNSEEILGRLFSTYGDLETHIRKMIDMFATKLNKIERAKKCINEANHIGRTITSQARKIAMEEIQYNERMNALKNELRTRINTTMDELLDKEVWKYEDGTSIDPISIELFKNEIEKFKNDVMISSIHHPKSILNEYEAAWLAAAMEETD